ncbi:MAG: hypothetical protein AB8B97_19585 [Granulosicoccus sp.]
MSPKSFGLLLVCLLDTLLLVDLVRGFQVLESMVAWGALHLVLCFSGACLLSTILHQLAQTHQKASVSDLTRPESKSGISVAISDARYPLRALVFLASVSIPGVGLIGISLSLMYGLRVSQKRTYTSDYWQVTPVASLPYVAPLDRKIQPADSRGFTEHLLYSTNDDDIYHKVLASANVKTSLAVDTLKQAMQHRDEKVRLTAYKTLDRKVTTLNKEIQRLEQALESDDAVNSSARFLQIANNYWELVTIEGSEAVARKQLLAKAAAAAIKAVSVLPNNRNAHLVLGRISLAQGDTRRASIAFERAQILGMPGDKVLPYLAECAFLERNLTRVQQLLSRLDPSIVAYPPLSHVARYWS